MTRSLRVLMIEESATDAILVAHALGEGERPISYERVEDEPALRAALEKGGWDLLVSAWVLPRLSATRAFDVMTEMGLDIPRVILCEAMKTATDAIRSGAREVLVKDNLARLQPAVERELRALVLRKAQREVESARATPSASFRRPEASGDASLADRLRRTFILIAALVSAAVVVAVLAFSYSWIWIVPDLEASQLSGAAANEASTALLDEETGLRGYLLTRDARFLEPYERGALAFARASSALDVHAAAVVPFALPLARTRAAEERWHDRWAALAAKAGPDGVPPSLEDGKKLFDAMRAEQAALATTIAQRTELLFAREQLATGVRLGLVLGILAALLLLVFRQHHALSDAIVAPVAALLQGMGRVRDGELIASFDHSGPSELRQLGAGLNDMVRALSAARLVAQARDELVREHANRLRQILDASREFSESLNLAYVVRSVRTSTIAVADCDEVVVWLMGDDQKGLRDATPVDPDAVPAELPDHSVAWRAAKSGRITFEAPDGRVRVGDPESLPVRAIVIPLIVGARVVGALEARHIHARIPNREAIEVLEMLAAHAATAIESARLNQITERTSQVDALTQLYNRRRLEEDLDAECKRSARYGSPLSFVMLDVDHFKAFNDTHGHPQADVALQQLAEVIAGAVRTTDTAYRYGGEEFCVLLRETHGDSAMIFAERLRQRIELRFVNGTMAGITASLGVGEFSIDTPTSHSLVEAADAAMYESKRGGRNRVGRTSRPPLISGYESGSMPIDGPGGSAPRASIVPITLRPVQSKSS